LFSHSFKKVAETIHGVMVSVQGLASNKQSDPAALLDNAGLVPSALRELEKALDETVRWADDLARSAASGVKEAHLRALQQGAALRLSSLAKALSWEWALLRHVSPLLLERLLHVVEHLLTPRTERPTEMIYCLPPSSLYATPPPLPFYQYR